VETFVLYPWNTGPASVASGSVTITDSLPLGLASVTATGTNWSCGISRRLDGRLHVHRPHCRNRSSAADHRHGDDHAHRFVSNCAVIALVGGVDNNPLDNWTVSCRPYTVNPIAPPSDVAIAKSGGGTVALGSLMTFTLNPTISAVQSLAAISVTDNAASRPHADTGKRNILVGASWLLLHQFREPDI